MRPLLFRITNSKVQTWLRCRKRYWFQYVSGAEWPPEVDTPGGIVGTGVHHAMKVLGETLQPAIARQQLDAYLRMPEHEMAGSGTSHYDRAFALFERGCEAFEELERDAVDRWVELSPGTRWAAGGIEIRSKIDRADRVADDHFRVIDWKTGRGDDDDETDLQLDIYHVALRDARRLPRETRVTAIAWNLESGRKRVRALNRDDAAATMQRLQALSQQMTRAQAFEATPNGLCPYCPWLAQCAEAAAAGFAPLPPADELAKDSPVGTDEGAA